MESLKSQKVLSDDELGEMPNFDLCGAFLREVGLFENIDAETETTESVESSKNSELKHGNEPSKRKRSIVILEEDEIEEFQKNQVAKIVKGTECAVRHLEAWYNERYGKKLVLTNINKANAAELLKHFFLEIRDTRKESLW
ncbi:hypothetical protein OS493_005335 [Desmophyllum pertusum]|uniref:Uncharacterized protein n=1 Tax=Desmophyllum pertusum TaxID=174260 RepID=A0A9W9YS34_9CNID|nr:hypothetical protein OS493_005335 [Desmophyllum pertusum]